ncbi:hypothetical protein [Sphingomonas japonica]|uniref:Uncharacterized protein n=1 Tax=Sphingomonas japonica TaxID=511662 RepID=A0ABX0U145_9SPHN|nr:hypothetical protein [Sphingomonas japonica]NIJ24208.1 hypothetical protein [Sphingomonas japonica]
MKSSENEETNTDRQGLPTSPIYRPADKSEARGTGGGVWVLHEASGLGREPFDTLWRILGDPIAHGFSESQSNYERGTKAMTQWSIIALNCGYPETIKAFAKIQKLASMGEKCPQPSKAI